MGHCVSHYVLIHSTDLASTAASTEAFRARLNKSLRKSCHKLILVHHHMELAKYVNWPLAVSIIGPEQRGPAATCILLSIWSEKPVPNHLGDENASSFRLAEAFGTATWRRGTLIGVLVTRGIVELARCLSAASGAKAFCSGEDPTASSVKPSPPSCCPEAASTSSGLRLTTVPFRMCFGGLFRAFFLPCLHGDVPATSVGDSLPSGDLGLQDVGELPKGTQCFSARLVL